MADDGHRISISEERLRLALAEQAAAQKLALVEMELRLKTYMDDMGKQKADRADFILMSARVDELDRGDFTPVHGRALEAFIDNHLSQQADRGWTARERRLGVVAILLTVLMFASSLYFGVRAASVHGSAAPQSSTSTRSTP
jgi:hypothetical protein